MMKTNPCDEIILSEAKFCNLGSGIPLDHRRGLTYPTVTDVGIVEMSYIQQQVYFKPK